MYLRCRVGALCESQRTGSTVVVGEILACHRELLCFSRSCMFTAVPLSSDAQGAGEGALCVKLHRRRALPRSRNRATPEYKQACIDAPANHALKLSAADQTC